jgi:hypothetical protein
MGLKDSSWGIPGFTGGDNRRLHGIYFNGDTTKRIKKKCFSRITYTLPEIPFPAGPVPGPGPEPP